MEERSLHHEQTNLSDILFLGFNYNNTYLTVGTTSGFAIYCVKPFKTIFKEKIGGISLIEMLDIKNLIALVGSSNGYNTSSRCLILWNAETRSAHTSFSFTSTIHTVKMNPKKIIIGLENDLRIYDLQSLSFLQTIKHALNYFNRPFVCCLSTSAENGYLVFPCSSFRFGGRINLFNTYTTEPSVQIEAHKSPVKLLAFNQQANMLATASIKGTIIRIWSIPDFNRIYSFRRSTIPLTLFQLSFSTSSKYIVSTGSSGSVYVFKLCSKDETMSNQQKISNKLQLNSEFVVTDNNAHTMSHQDQVSFDNIENLNYNSYTQEKSQNTLHHNSSYWNSNIYMNFLKEFCHSSFSSILYYLPSSYKEVIDTIQCFTWLNLGQPCSSLPSVAIVIETMPEEKLTSIQDEIFIACHAGCAYLYEFSSVRNEEARIRDEFVISRAAILNK